MAKFANVAIHVLMEHVKAPGHSSPGREWSSPSGRNPRAHGTREGSHPPEGLTDMKVAIHVLMEHVKAQLVDSAAQRRQVAIHVLMEHVKALTGIHQNNSLVSQSTCSWNT